MRIVAGTLGGRRIKAPPGRGTRPTSDRVREAVFSMLGDLTDLTVLDLFSGSGALGIEALSRGAMSATFVEPNQTAMRVLRENLAALGLKERAITHRRDWRAALESEAVAGRRYDVCVADPPYSMTSGFASRVDAVFPLLTPGARVVVEHSRTFEPRLEGLIDVRVKRYGNTAVTIGSYGEGGGG